jgi:hypothetical protein
MDQTIYRAWIKRTTGGRRRGGGVSIPRRAQPQLLSHAAVGEIVQGVFSRPEHLKEHALVARPGIEALTVRPSLVGARRAQPPRERRESGIAPPGLTD